MSTVNVWYCWEGQGRFVKISDLLPHIILLGHLNFPGVNWEYPKQNSRLESLNGLFFIVRVINQLTRKQTILDLLITDPVYMNIIGKCETPISDHNIVYVNINMIPSLMRLILFSPFESLT